MSESKAPEPIPRPPHLLAAVAEFERADERARKGSLAMLVIGVIGTILAFFVLEGRAAHVMQRNCVLMAAMWALVIITPLVAMRLGSTRVRASGGGDPDAKIGSISRRDLQAIIADAERAFPGREQPAVYILQSSMPNAMAVNTRYADILPPFNAIYLTRPLLEALNKDEIRAVYMHELAHFHRYTYADARSKIGIYLSIGYGLGTASILAGPDGLGWIGAAVATCAVLFLLGWSLGLSARVDRNIEFLCDHFAAVHAGKLNIVNGLIAIGRASRSPLQKLGLLNKLSGKLAGRKSLRWESIDSSVPNGRLEPDEYARLIALLREQHDAVILGLPIDIESDSHPSLARRILFLEDSGVE